jgi:hypothetical protein
MLFDRILSDTAPRISAILGDQMLHSESKAGVEAFNKALAAVYAWTIEEEEASSGEPSSVQRCSIGAMCDLIEVFDDPMPENVYQFLTWMAAEHSVTAPADRSYASGSIRLRALRDKNLSPADTGLQRYP